MAQEGVFVAPFHEGGYPVQTADALIAVDAVGVLQGFHGRPWWHAMAYCVGSYESAAQALETAGNIAEAQALRDTSYWEFHLPAISGLADDRGISEEEAIEIMRPDINYQILVAMGDARPFEPDQERCATIAVAFAAPRQAPAKAVAPPAEPVAKDEVRRFAAVSDVTREHDGAPYWELMLRCAMGSNGVAGREQWGQLFVSTAAQLLLEQGMDQAAARATMEQAVTVLAPIPPGPTEERDACMVIGRQLRAELTAG